VDFYKLFPKKQFDGEIRDFQGDLKRLSDVEVVFRFMRLGARVGVAHTWVGFPPKTPRFHGYPFVLHWFSDGLAVVAAAPEYRRLIGAQVVKIGLMTPDRAVALVEPFISHENRSWLYEQSPLLLRNAELLQQLKIAQPDGRLRLSLKFTDGQPLSMEIPPGESGEPSQWISAWAALSIRPVAGLRRHTSYSYRCLPEAEEPYWNEFLPQAEALYVHYKDCWDAHLSLREVCRKSTFLC
jgi:hypothetical protein